MPRAARAEVLARPASQRRELALESFLLQPEPPPLALLPALRPEAEPQEREAPAVQLLRASEAQPVRAVQLRPAGSLEVLPAKEQAEEQTLQAGQQRQLEQEAPAPGPGAALPVPASPVFQRRAEARGRRPALPAA